MGHPIQGDVTVDSAVRAAAGVLATAGIEAAGAEAELLLAHVLRMDRRDLAKRRAVGDELLESAAARFHDLVARRARRVPLQHLTGVAHFRRISLDVGPGVFVPRPETEIAVGLALSAVLAAPWRPVRLVDLCAGSGVIALSVVKEAAAAGVEVSAVAVELSPAAVVWTRRNVERLGAGRVEVREQGVAQCCTDLDGRVDVVTANPPYIPDGAVPRDPEVRDHDPAVALFGGADGLDVVRQVARTAARLCRADGSVVIEHGEYQGPAVAGILQDAGFRDPVTHRDLTRRPRTTVAVQDC